MPESGVSLHSGGVSARVFESCDPEATAVEVDGVVKHVEVQEIDIDDLLGPFCMKIVLAYSEWRMKFSEWQWSTGPIFYHAFLLLEIQGGFGICTEKYSDKLELVLGRTDLLRAYSTKHHSSGIPRRTSLAQPRCELNQVVTVGDLMQWISGPLAMVWKPYDLFFSNCQGYVSDVVAFFEDPSIVERPCEDREIMLMAVSRDGLMLRFASVELRKDWNLVHAAVAQNGLALRHAEKTLRRDMNLVTIAVTQSGSALQYASSELRRDPDVALLAVKQDATALHYVANNLKRDREIVTAALASCGHDFGHLFASDPLKQDREVAVMAVRFDGFALRHLAPVLKRDRQIVQLAGQQCGGLDKLLSHAQLRADRDVMLAAVGISGFALQLARLLLQFSEPGMPRTRSEAILK